MITRREFIRGVAATACLAAAGLEQRAAAAPLNSRALLYDLQLGSFKTERGASALLKKVREDPEVGRFAQLVQAGTEYKVILDINAPAPHADAIAGKIEDIVPDAFKFLTPSYYNAGSTSGRFANLVVERSLKNTILKYTTAYTQGEVDQTAATLVEYYRSKKLFGKDGIPASGDVIPVPIRFLKTPYRTGMVEGRDYHAVDLERGQTLLGIAQTMPGDARNNAEILFKFNGIGERWQLRALPEGTRIMVPEVVVGDPSEPVVVAENGPGIDYKIIPQQTPTSEIQDALEKEIPEVRSSVDAYLKAQNLGVLRGTNMPSVLTESFNIQNFGQRKFYNNEDRLRGLAEAYGRGILEYRRKHNPGLRKVIVDNGHGQRDPGAIHAASGMTETQFTQRIQGHLVRYLDRHGLDARAIDYEGSPSPRARLKHYTSTANRLGNSSDSVYISVHVDSLGAKSAPPPRVFVHIGRQEQSEALARCMLEQAVPYYKRNYR